MSDIRHVLLIPAEGDPHGLLREGPCGARPPIVARPIGHEPFPWQAAGGLFTTLALPARAAAASVIDFREASRGLGEFLHEYALVLAWDGEVVPEGVDRVKRILAPRRFRDGGVQRRVQDLLAGRLGHRLTARWLLPHDRGIGTLLVVDAEGREVSDV